MSSSQNLQENRPWFSGWCRRLTFAGSDVIQVQLVALLGSLQGALGGEELAGGLVGLVVSAADLRHGDEGSAHQSRDFCLRA